MSTTAATKPQPAATFGRPLGSLKPDPSEFTRAHTGAPELPPVAPPTRPKEHVKPLLPPKEEVPLMGLVSARNYVLSNAVETVLSAARKPPPPPPPATAKPDYGRVPSYLAGHKARLAADKAAVEAAAREAEAVAEAASGVRLLGDDERLELLAALQAKWAKVNRAYSCLPLVCDTDPAKRRKEAHEAELSQLEADIAILQRGNVLVSTLE